MLRTALKVETEKVALMKSGEDGRERSMTAERSSVQSKQFNVAAFSARQASRPDVGLQLCPPSSSPFRAWAHYTGG